MFQKNVFGRSKVSLESPRKPNWLLTSKKKVKQQSIKSERSTPEPAWLGADLVMGLLDALYVCILMIYLFL